MLILPMLNPKKVDILEKPKDFFIFAGLGKQ